jgi:hypothetical protein
MKCRISQSILSLRIINSVKNDPLTIHRNAVFLGAPWNGIVFQLPQRFQVIDGTSAIGAGVRLLPVTASAPVRFIVTAGLAKKGVPPIYLIIFASALQVLGFALLGTLRSHDGLGAAQYGYQAMAAFGSGTISLLTLMTPFSVEPRDKGRPSAVSFSRSEF